MSTQEQILTKDELKVLLWVSTLNDYEDSFFDKSDLTAKLDNFIENYQEKVMEIELDTFTSALDKLAKLGILEINDAEEICKVTDKGYNIINALLKIEGFSHNLRKLLETPKKLEQVIKDSLEKIDFTLIKFDIKISLF